MRLWQPAIHIVNVMRQVLLDHMTLSRLPNDVLQIIEYIAREAVCKEYNVPVEYRNALFK